MMITAFQVYTGLYGPFEKKIHDSVPKNSMPYMNIEKEDWKDKKVTVMGLSCLNFKIDQGQQVGHPDAPERFGLTLSHSILTKTDNIIVTIAFDSHPLCKLKSHVTEQAMYLDLPPS